MEDQSFPLYQWSRFGKNGDQVVVRTNTFETFKVAIKEALGVLKASEIATPKNDVVAAYQASHPDDRTSASCPVCNGEMWDNRPKKVSGQYSPTSPNFKCKDKNCAGVIWPPKQ